MITLSSYFIASLLMVRFLVNVDLGEVGIDEIVKALDKIYVKAAKWFSSIMLDKKKDCYELIFTPHFRPKFQ